MTTGEGQTRILSYPELEPVLRFDYDLDPDTGKGKEFKLTGHTSSCSTAELQPTGRYLATGGTDSIIALWDTTDWLCRRTLSKMSGPVRSISECRHLRLGKAQSWYLLTRILGFTFDGSFIAGGSDEGMSTNPICILICDESLDILSGTAQLGFTRPCRQLLIRL